jgi:hypothetical protein
MATACVQCGQSLVSRGGGLHFFRCAGHGCGGTRYCRACFVALRDGLGPGWSPSYPLETNRCLGYCPLCAAA